MAASPFDLSHAPPVGVAEALAPGLRVVTAPNAGPMTFTGTRSYIVGEGEVAVIDPGPDDPRHLDALARGGRGRAGGGGAGHPRAPRPQRRGAAPSPSGSGRRCSAHGDPAGARRRRWRGWRRPAGIGGGEGIDAGFRPDRRIGEGDVVAGPGWTLTALATPGHTADHLSFAWAEGNALFSGDQVMGWATTLISPPDGDLGRVPGEPRAAAGARRGGLLSRATARRSRDPQAVMAHVLAHRAGREAEILAALARGPATVAALVAAIYAGVDPALHAAAARNVLAHLIDLAERGLAAAEGPPAAGAWRLAATP